MGRPRRVEPEATPEVSPQGAVRVAHFEDPSLSHGVDGRGAGSMYGLAEALPANELAFDSERYIQYSQPAPLERDDLETANLDAPRATGPQPSRVWTIDYRLRSVSNSHTSYEFGTSEVPPAGWTPLSRLDFPLNSFWHGLEVGM